MSPEADGMYSVNIEWSSENITEAAEMAAHISEISEKEEGLTLVAKTEIEDALNKGNVVTAMEGNNLVGFAQLVPIQGGTIIKTVYVNPDYRYSERPGENVSDRLLQEITLKQKDKLYLDTTNPAMGKLAQRNGFREANWRDTPIVVLANLYEFAKNPRTYIKGLSSEGNGGFYGMYIKDMQK